MEWTNDNVLHLLELYRNRPVLWDCCLKEYKDRNKRIEALLEIATIFSVEKEEIERKLKNLVCHFSREIKREKEGVKLGAGNEGYKSKWFCYNNMLFLRERNRSRATSGNITQNNKTNHAAQSNLGESRTRNYAEESKTMNGLNLDVNGKGKKILLKSQKGQTTSHKMYASEETITVPKDSHKDQYTAFGEQVGIRIRDLSSPHARNLVKHFISTILFEGETGKFDNPNSISYFYLHPFYHIPQFGFPAVPESISSSNSLFQQPYIPSRLSTPNQNQPQSSPVQSSDDENTDRDSIDTILKQI